MFVLFLVRYIDILKLRNRFIEIECIEFLQKSIHDKEPIPNAVATFKLALYDEESSVD